MLEPLDMTTLFHSVLFAYQKAIKQILGSEAASAFIHPVLETVRKINEKKGVTLIEGKDLDEVLENLSRNFINTGLVKEATFQKIGSERYLFRIDRCLWAKSVHKELELVDVTCPYALVAMAIFQEVTGKKVKVRESNYFVEGCETIIEPR